MRTITPLFFLVSVSGTLVSCAPDGKNADSTKDSSSTDSTVVDLNTDELSSGDVQQIVFNSTTPFAYHHAYWSGRSSTNNAPNTDRLADNTQPSDILLYVNVDSTYVAGTGTWSVEDPVTGAAHDLFEITAGATEVPRLSVRELNGSGYIGGLTISRPLTSLSRGNETYQFSIENNGSEVAYCKSLASNSGSTDSDRVCASCVQPDGSAYTGALGQSQNSNFTCDETPNSKYFGANVVYNDGTSTHEQIVWLETYSTSYTAPTLSGFDNTNDGTSGGFTYTHTDGTELVLDDGGDATYSSGSTFLFDKDEEDAAELFLRLYGCTTSDLLYIESGTAWNVDNQDELDYVATRIMDMIFRPSVSQNASWNTSNTTANTISTYPAFVAVKTTSPLADYCELEFNFRDAANSTSPDYIQDMIRSVTYRYSDGGSAIANEGLRTIQAYLINEDNPSGTGFAVVSAPSEIDIAVYNNPTLTDNTTATVFDATPTVDIEADYNVSLAVSGTYSDGDPCFIDVSTLTASTSTNVTFTKSSGAGLPDGTHTCTITPTRTVTPTRVTDGETLSFDFTGTSQTFSLPVDTTPPNVTIDAEVANVNGYANSLTPTFDVSSDEAGTLTVGGSCSITGQSTISASSSTTITLDTLTEGTTYSDCTVTVTDDAGNASTPVTLSAFTVDVTNPSISYSLASSLTINSNATDDTTPDLEITVPVTETNVTMSVNSGTTSACAVSSGALSGAGVTNTITFTADSGGTVFTDGQIQCLVDLEDLAGNTAQETISFYVDVAAPVISVTAHPTTPTSLPTFSLDTNENGTLSLSGDCATGTVSVSGSTSISDTSAGSPAQVTISGLSEGSYYTCEVVVTDIAGRATSASVNSFSVDTTSDAPVITGITSDTGSSSTDGVTNASAVEFIGTSEAGAEVTLTATNTSTSTTTTCITTASSSGAWTCNASSSSLDTYVTTSFVQVATSTSYTVTATAIDALSNATSSVSNTYNLTVDSDNPTLTATSMGTVAESNPTVTLTSDESGVSVFELGVGLSDDCANLSYTRTADTTNGNDFILQHATNGGFADNTGSTYTCTATVTDPAGNTSSEEVFTFEVTLSGVVISESAPADATTGSGNVTSSTAPTVKIYSNTAIDEANGDTFAWTGGCETSGTTLSANGVTELTLVATGGSAFANDGTADGVYSCSLEVTENATSTTSNALTLSSFTIDTTGPTIAVTDTDSNVGTSISFAETLSAGTIVATVTGTDTFATTVTYTEDAGGDTTANGIFEIDASTGVVSLTTTASQGTYTYSVIVSDDALPTNNTTSESITFTVVEGNAAPVLDDTYVANFTAISEHITTTANVGQAISTLLTDGTTPAITDSNTTSVQGIAIYDATATGSSEWQYSGDNGTTWTQITGVDAQSVLVLADTDLVRLSPTVANGETGTLSFYAWDQTDGTQYNTETVNTRGGTTAYSTASATVSITVTDVNDAPSLVSGTTVSLTAITEGSTSSATLLNSAVSSLITDTDTASNFASLGVAVVGMTEAASGSWQYSTDGGSSWSNFSDLSSTLSETAAFLIDASGANGQIRFASSAPNGETATLTFFAWDQSSGTAGTQVDITAVYNDVDSPYSAPDATDTVSNGGNVFSLVVNDENDAPVLASTVADFASIAEYETTNTGSTVGTLLNGALTDVDTTSSQGIAIYSVVAGNGSWEYSADGTNWTAFPTVSSTGALVLTDTDSIRFVPSNTNADSASITYYGWDQSDSSASGSTVDVSTTGGSTAFSVANATSSITVTDANNQPVLDTTTSPIVMTAFNEGDTSSTTTSASLLISAGIGSTISDVDTSSSSGIAITSASTSNGYWEYSADNTNWTTVPTVSTTSAMVLDSSYYLRFVSTGPDGVTATLDFVAWDQTDGNTSETTGVDTTATFSPSNISPFSTSSNTLSVVVTDLNDAPELAGVTTSLGTITEDDADVAESNVTTYQLSSVLSTIITDTDTTSSFNNLGIAVTGVSSTNGRWDSSLDGTTWTEIVGASSTNVLVLDDSAFLRFIPDSTAGTTATLTFLAWDQSDSETSGSFVTISSGNQGNDGAYSLNEDTFSVTVTDVNDQPVITGPSSITLTPAIQEGQLSAAFNLFTELDPLNTITDADETPLTTMGVALTSASTTRGYWEYSTDGETTWSTIPSTTSTSNALLFDVSSATVAPSVRFQATGNNGVTAELIVYAWDQSSSPSPADVGTANSTNGTTSAFSSSSVSLTLQVNDINNQPVLDISTSPIVLTAINEGDVDAITYATALISTEIGSTISDVDTSSSSGIAITSASTSNGYWEYTLDGSTWNAVPTVSTTSALVLDSADSVRFASTGPDGVTATLDFMAWDQSDGSNAGDLVDTTATFTPASISPFSTTSNTLSVVVTDLNDAPELSSTSTTIALGTISEDDTPTTGLTTFQVSTVVASNYTDTDTTSAFNNLGIAVYGVSTTNGYWEYSMDAELTWTAIPGVTTSTVLLLDGADFVRFVPNEENGSTATLDFYGWDQSNNPTLASNNTTTLTTGEQGDAGAYSLTGNQLSLTVSDVNDAPVYTTTGTTTLTALTEDDVDNSGQLVSALVGANTADVDAGSVYGIAVTGLTSGVGTWEFNLNDGSGWQTVEGSTTLTTSNARAIPSTASLRFNPNASAENGESTDPTISYYVWDQTTGSAGALLSAATVGGTTAFSTASETASVVVADVNDAPVVASASNFTTITEDDNQTTNPTLIAQISSLVTLTDVDNSAPAEGIAIIGQTATNGVWKYSLDGANWATLSIATGALVLDINDYLAFVPNESNGGTSTLEFYGWDQYSASVAPAAGTNISIASTGTSTPFSATSTTIEIVVTEVNDSPVWPSGTQGANFTAITEDQINNSGNTVADLLNSLDSDEDTGSTRGIVVYATDIGSNGTGAWEYSVDAGANWSSVPSVSVSAALALRETDKLRFVPDGDNGESTNPYVDFYLWDGNPAFFGTQLDATTRADTDDTANFSANSGRSEIVVSDVNDAPVIVASTLGYSEGETLVQLNATDAVGNNGNITITEVDIGDTLEVVLTLPSTNWPYDPAAPDDALSTRTFNENNVDVVLDVVDEFGGTLNTSSTSWDSSTNSLTLTGSVTSINTELTTLSFTPTAGLTPTDSATTGAPDFDLDTLVSIAVSDATTGSDSQSVTLSCDTDVNDRPISIVYWEAYENETGAENANPNLLLVELTEELLNTTSPYVRVDARMSWDPDDQDDIVSYTFTPNIPVSMNCAGTLLPNATSCTLTNGDSYITYEAINATITWTVSVEDNDGQSNTVADLHDQTIVSIANQPPEVTVYLASEADTCTRAHATGTLNPVYADMDADCFCEQANCGQGNPVCADRDGITCNPTLDNQTFPTCVEIAATYADANRGTSSACYCEELDCDGTNDLGEPNCYDEFGQTCTPVLTGSLDSCAPIVSPNDLDFPYDVNLELVACAYDPNGDTLSFNWSVSSGLAVATETLNASAETAYLKVTPGSSGYVASDTLDLTLEVTDVEDTISRTMDFNFCAGWFHDADADGYGALNDFQAACSSSVSTTFDMSMQPDTAVSVVQGNDYLGLDCLDTGVITDNSSLYGNLASVVALTAAQVQDSVSWYVDYDDDGYGAMTGGRGDNGSGQFELTDGGGNVTDTFNIVYSDVNNACTMTNPTVTLSTGEVKNYLLNSDDCNDILDFSDGVYTTSPSTGGLGASNQNPETVWFADIDGDGFGIGMSTDTSANFLYPDADFDCLCTSASGSCSSLVNNYQLVTGLTSTTCVKTGTLYSYKIKYQQCDSPTEATNTSSLPGLPGSWVLNNGAGFGDCDETNAFINEGAQERCDSLDVDEDCDGLADDNDNNGTVSGALTYFVDNDGDAYPTPVGKVFSCDGNTSSGASTLVYYYTLDPNNATINSSTTTSGQCICPTDTCSEACRLASNSSISCEPTDLTVFTNGDSHCAGISNSSGNFNFTKTPFDFTGTTFADFAPYVQDCDDNSNDVYPRAEEACDGVLNDCVSSAGGVPTDEVDYDNDGYVECEFDGSNWNGANTPLVGADCAPIDTNVYPNAPSICDGQYNNCASWRPTYVDVDRECFCYAVDANNSTLCDVNTCVDSDGASCTPASDSNGAQVCELWADVTERYVDEAGSCFCDSTNNQGNCNSEVCHTSEGIACTPVDLNGNGFAACTEIAFENKMSPGAPANQVDDDGDCYVECYDGTTSWAGGTALLGSSCSDIMEGQDCNDTVSLVYPGAIEVCDGQFNNCNSPSFSATGAPVNETDNDGDGFVECLSGEYMDLNGCRCLSASDDGSGGLIYNQCTNSRGQTCTPNATVAEVTWVTGSTGYGDCDDLDDSRYPSAPEICDGIFNDCDHPLLDAFVGASGADCFCDDNAGSNCVDSSGAVCSVNVNLVDLVQLSRPETVGGTNYEYQQVECYCSTSDCEIDVDGDGASDCLDQNDDPCVPTDANSDGLADTCIVDPLNAQTSVALSKSMYAFSGAPGRELDNDGDNYVDCNYTSGLWVGSAYVVGGLDCNDFPTNNGSRVYPSATEHCDGIYNNCSDPTYSATNPPTDESDVDNDGFVECTLTPGYAWVGDETPIGYADCVDSDRLVYPGATEACDGIFNNCSANGYSASSAPITEQDNDGDGFVECSDVYYADANSCVCQGIVDSTGTLNYTNCVWNQSTCIPDLTSIVPLGWSGDTITGYDDCNDTNATIYPSATEVCDGRFNDCDHPLKPSGSNGGVYSGVVGDCFCAVVDTDSDGTADACDATACVDSNNNTCTPTDDDQDGLVDVCEIADTTGTDFVNTGTYFGAEVDCYCPSIDCMMDATGNAVTDCYTPDGSTCNMPIDNNGLAEDCLTSLASPVLTVAHIFVDSNGNQVAKPWEEIDNDSDGYVECDEFDLSTYRAGGGSFSVVGGSDCNDGDGYVYPAATEYCDGVFNDCDNVAYNIQPAPADEIDNDGDGFVECTFTTGVNWRGNTVPTGDEDCDDTRATVYPNAVEICDGLFNNCSIYNYSATGAPADETDNDGDGYVECLSGGYVDSSGCACDTAEDTNFDGVFDAFTNCVDGFGQTCTPIPEDLVGVVWDGPTEPTGYGDCLDSDPEQFPSAEEICDGLFNNCAHPQKSAFEGIVSDCMCPTADTNGDGDDDSCVATGCLDSNGATCTPVDEDADGYVDAPYCAISSTPEQVTGQGLMGVEVDCYCPSVSCQLDVLGDGSSDCLTPTGEECIPSDNNNVGFADACLTDTEGLTISHAFLQANGNSLTRPFNETDNDGDGYVECEYIEETWLGSFNVVGGLDCDDADGAVYPTAAEVCDGQFNDCANNYVENSAPVNELDNDGDGWIECSRDIDVVWNSFDGSIEPNNYGYGTDGIVSGSSVCVCDDTSCSTNCSDANGNSCIVPTGECNRLISYDHTDCDDADQYTHPFVALNEYEEAGDGIGIFSCVRDRDGDGYGDANPSNPLVEAGHDCDDSNLYVHPQQNEICEVGDQIDSDCNGNVNTAEYQDGFILDTNGQGSLLYVDADGDGFGDSEIAATPACEVSSGFVFNATDCNDEDSTINPNSKEICDGIDQDCDLTIDEPDSLDDPAISKCTYMYRDVDADSYGDADYSACLCQEGSNPSVTYNDYEYVIYSGDCYDYNADIKPLSCSDGIDQDDDGFVDDEDPNCIAGFQEGSDTIKEEAFELLDGHDNNCDGLVAAVELDCDDDGSFALVPGESSGFNRSAKFQMAADIGLEACSGLSTTIDCWGDPQRLVCDALTAEINDGTIEYKGTGLWMLSINESDDGYGGRFDGGHREYPEGRTCGATRGDCDDQCPDRCPDQVESCDGIDNDCSNASPGVDGHAGDAYLGIPDAMIAEIPIAGTISDAEIDIDSDGYLACESFISSGAQNQWSDESCDTTLSVSEDNDCNNYCFFTSPTAEERCDAFQGTCGGENLDGTDNDYDDMLTCGTWGADETLAEDIYMVVWMKDVDWSRLASEEHELIRPVRTADDIARVLAEPTVEDSGEYFDTAADTASVDTASKYESLQETESESVLRKRRDFINERLPIMNTNAGFIGGDIEIDLLERMIPLVSPRALAPYCDSYLMDQLTLLLGIDNMEALRQTNDPKEQADILLEACDQSIDGVAGCGVVRLSLSRTTDDETYEYLDAIQSEILSFSTECEDKPEEWISRSMWQRERIVEARTITVEWECRRMFGQACDEISDQTSLVDGWQDSIVSPERWLDVDRAWFKEIGRYNPEAIDGGTLMSCWGDPTDPTAKFSEDVGGDCADDDSSAHRDMPEGPGDLVGLYLYGEMADCDTCLDGIDNNCDGAIDCADPACAPCFVGQGVGCGGGADSPCSQGGCASPDQSGKERMYRSFGLIMMAMFITIIRRREKRYTA